MLRVFEVTYTSEDFRPVIVFHDPRNAENDWLRADEVMDGLREDTEFLKICLSVDHADATSYHGYQDGGMGGLYSEEFLRFLGKDVLQDFQLFPGTINGARYCFLKRVNWQDCFDLVNSKYEFFRSRPEQIRFIESYAFLEDAVPRDRLFAIPQAPMKLLAAEEVAQRIMKARFRGIECRELTGIS